MLLWNAKSIKNVLFTLSQIVLLVLPTEGFHVTAVGGCPLFNRVEVYAIAGFHCVCLMSLLVPRGDASLPLPLYFDIPTMYLFPLDYKNDSIF